MLINTFHHFLNFIVQAKGLDLNDSPKVLPARTCSGVVAERMEPCAWSAEHFPSQDSRRAVRGQIWHGACKPVLDSVFTTHHFLGQVSERPR